MKIVPMVTIAVTTNKKFLILNGTKLTVLKDKVRYSSSYQSFFIDLTIISF